MAGFVRAAAKEKARALIEQERRIALSNRDFAAVAAAVDRAFEPNDALRSAIASARTSVVLEERRLDTDLHDGAAFDCGVPALNEYLRKFAGQHRRRGVSQTYVIVDDAVPSAVLGY